MKNILLILSFISCFNLFSQELPTEPAKGFAFPLGSKFTIKLYPTDSINFNYSIIKFEEYRGVVNLFEDELFSETENYEENTIEFYFCYATTGDTEEEKEKNMKIVLKAKNRTKYILEYVSDIQREEDGEFENTSNVGLFPNASATEMWPYMIYHIGLSDFKLIEK
ncbi:hypothetical protein [Aureivirga sp. CE67]|uniref:hypothetical protein n=1 Tax=Aureivirga sp. CE67 TaxID=1788983 RepID=UPI0018CA0CAA|nr:hypothetical protein [Aureivirga sp. CE67]